MSELNAEISSFPLHEATCREKHIFCTEVKGHITKSPSLLLLESVQSRLPTRQRGCFLLLLLLSLRLLFQTALHCVSDDFLLVQEDVIKQLANLCINFYRVFQTFTLMCILALDCWFFCFVWVFHCFLSTLCLQTLPGNVSLFLKVTSLDTDPLVLVSHLLLALFNIASRAPPLFLVLGNKFFFALRLVALQESKKIKA